jgi:hypothetical protein
MMCLLECLQSLIHFLKQLLFSCYITLCPSHFERRFITKGSLSCHCGVFKHYYGFMIITLYLCFKFYMSIKEAKHFFLRTISLFNLE